MVKIVEIRGAEIDRYAVNGESIADIVASEPGNGVYTVARTYRFGMVLDMDAHFDRMERSARALGRSLTVPRDVIRQELSHERPKDGDIRFRITAVLDRDVWYRVSIETARDLPLSVREKGVTCATVVDSTRDNPTVKSTSWMHTRRRLSAKSDTPESDVYEYLLTDSTGTILEGSSSNFYAVVDGTLRTAGSGVLEGISRSIILEIADAVLPIAEEPITVADVAAGVVREAWISSATRGIVPIHRIDTYHLGPPGPIVQTLTVLWDQWMDKHLVPLVRTTAR